ncbi:KilA-N domain-containing protein [Providencia rettgeri]|uniref:KilA-N domain-containing protein n=1 Tax=Providencia rettgeri TaxID=587 RepID=UPI0018D59828|nr:KilA-N domain-containing protein [Providencia rettgeri]
MTNQLIISNTSIRKDSVCRYSLNDLHKASGNQDKDKPANWLRSEKTIELIEEILIAHNREVKKQDSDFKPVVSKSGRYGGTYVCKELVYSYAMWISAAFALKVIRAYDDLVSGRVEQAIRRSTVQERNPLKDAVNLLVSKKSIMYPEAYAFVHQRFNISSIEELTTNQIPEAVEYIHKIVLEGDYIPKEDPRETTHLYVNKDRDIHNINALAKHYEAIYTAWKVELYPALRSIDSPVAPRLYDRFKDGYSFLRMLQESLNGKHPALIK